MEHRDHHLYQLIRYICEEYDKCNASRETLARAIGLSAKSIRLITESWKTLQDEYLIDVEERECAPPVITLAEHHKSYYDAILYGEFADALDERQMENLLGQNEATGPRASDNKTSDEIVTAFREEDFDLTDGKKKNQGATGEDL